MEECPGNSLSHLPVAQSQLHSWVGGQVVGTNWTTQADNTAEIPKSGEFPQGVKFCCRGMHLYWVSISRV